MRAGHDSKAFQSFCHQCGLEPAYADYLVSLRGIPKEATESRNTFPLLFLFASLRCPFFIPAWTCLSFDPLLWISLFRSLSVIFSSLVLYCRVDASAPESLFVCKISRFTFQATWSSGVLFPNCSLGDVIAPLT
jgi:hypothetical protein